MRPRPLFRVHFDGLETAAQDWGDYAQEILSDLLDHHPHLVETAARLQQWIDDYLSED